MGQIYLIFNQLPFLWDTSVVLYFTTLQGLPYAVTPSGMSLTTTLPAPIMQSLPILIPCFTTLPAPIHEPSPTTTPPANVAWGAMCTKSPTTASWPTEEPVFMMQCLPIVAHEFIKAPAITTVPSPILALGEITAEGWIAVSQLLTVNFVAMSRRIWQLPIAIIAALYFSVLRLTS